MHENCIKLLKKSVYYDIMILINVGGKGFDTQ